MNADQAILTLSVAASLATVWAGIATTLWLNGKLRHQATRAELVAERDRSLRVDARSVAAARAAAAILREAREYGWRPAGPDGPPGQLEPQLDSSTLRERFERTRETVVFPRIQPVPPLPPNFIANSERRHTWWRGAQDGTPPPQPEAKVHQGQPIPQHRPGGRANLRIIP